MLFWNFLRSSQWSPVHFSVSSQIHSKGSFWQCPFWHPSKVIQESHWIPSQPISQAQWFGATQFPWTQVWLFPKSQTGMVQSFSIPDHPWWHITWPESSQVYVLLFCNFFYKKEKFEWKLYSIFIESKGNKLVIS